jgi:predicted nucleic acid-binding protein
MIVVSNTSPLTNLAAISQFDLLRKLFGQVHIPDAEWSELNAFGKRWPGSLEVENSERITRHNVKNQLLVTALSRDLDRGEAESIVLAIELNADVVLLDEKDGRHAAQRLNLSILGVVGVLLLAYRKKEIGAIKPYLDALRQTAGFYMSESIYQAVLKEANENL